MHINKKIFNYLILSQLVSGTYYIPLNAVKDFMQKLNSCLQFSQNFCFFLFFKVDCKSHPRTNIGDVGVRVKLCNRKKNLWTLDM